MCSLIFIIKITIFLTFYNLNGILNRGLDSVKLYYYYEIKIEGKKALDLLNFYY